MKSGHSGKKYNFLHISFPFHLHYSLPLLHSPSSEAEETLRIVSLGSKNIKLLLSAKKKKEEEKNHQPALQLHQPQPSAITNQAATGQKFLVHLFILETFHFTNLSNTRHHQVRLAGTSDFLAPSKLISIFRGRT